MPHVLCLFLTSILPSRHNDAMSATHTPTQAGNDFLPNVPSIDIYDKPCGLDLLISAFKALLPGMGGHITGADGSRVVGERAYVVLSYVVVV